MTEVTIPIIPSAMSSLQKDPKLSSSFKLSKAGASDKPALAVVVAAGIKKSMLKQGGVYNELDYAKGPEMIAILKSTLDPTPVAMGIKRATFGKNKKGYDIKPYDEVAMLAGRRADKPEVQKVAKDLGKAVKRNPKGRGKFLHIEIHPKTQLEMKKRDPELRRALEHPEKQDMETSQRKEPATGQEDFPSSSRNANGASWNPQKDRRRSPIQN